MVLGTVPQLLVHPAGDRRCAGVAGIHHRFCDVYPPGGGGVYFAIITQAIAAILTILIIGQQGYTGGGVNGITDLQTLMGWDIRTDEAKTILYFVCVGLLFVCLFVARFVQNRKLGRILVAMNAQENRVRFSGYDVAAFKIFVFCLAAAFAGIGGALFTLIVASCRPRSSASLPPLKWSSSVPRGGSPVDSGRSLRRVAGERRQERLLRILPGIVAVRHGRVVHRCGAGVPERPGRPVPDLRDAPPGRPSVQAQAESSGERPPGEASACCPPRGGP